MEAGLLESYEEIEGTGELAGDANVKSRDNAESNGVACGR